MKQAPNFTLPDQHGEQHSLNDYAGKWLILYFYPQDETPGCTEEACVFRDGRQDLVDAGAEVVGVSADTVESHKKFADNHSLNFTILADPDQHMIKAYDALNEETGRTLRSTFLINPQGEIVKIYEQVSPTGHAIAILQDLQALQK
jgi:peroxiredoxin Q/BCP